VPNARHTEPLDSDIEEDYVDCDEEDEGEEGREDSGIDDHGKEALEMELVERMLARRAATHAPPTHIPEQHQARNPTYQPQTSESHRGATNGYSNQYGYSGHTGRVEVQSGGNNAGHTPP